MNILEQIYEINFHKINFTERKVAITHNNTVIMGPPKSGKTYLIYDYLTSYKENEYLYIDFLDYKNDRNEISKYLEDFIKTHTIKVLILENFNFDINIPQGLESTLITTNEVKKLEGFETIYVEGLDFEEFLLFDTKHQTSSNSFNSFLKFGNFPEIIEYSENKKINRNYEISKLYCDDFIQMQILFLFIKNVGEKKSIYQLFNSLKKEHKVSKDRFYNTTELFDRNRVLYFCQKYEQPKATKKIFVHNHALLDIVSYKKNFNNLFKNMTFLELNKRYEEICYLEDIDFFLSKENEIVLAIPFFNNLISTNVIAKILPSIDMYQIKYITIVTVSTRESIFIGEIEAQIVPFRKWAVSL